MKSTSHGPYPLVLGLLCLVLLSTSSAEDRAGQDPLATYLQQAFSAPDSKARPALFHIGIQGYETQDGFLVSAVLEGYPAFIAGIRRGDRISLLNGEEFHPIKSLKGSDELELKISRGEQELNFEVVPVYENLYDSYRSATNSSLQTFSAGNKIIGYMRPWALSRNTADLETFLELVSDLDYCDGLIIDLRGAFGFVHQTHIDAFVANNNNIDHFEKAIVVMFDSSSSPGAISLAKRMGELQRIITLGSGPQGDLVPESLVNYPYEKVSRNDPQFDGALNQLLGTI